LILDFVDVSSLSLCTLPSLFGAPKDLDLQGGDAVEAGRAYRQLLFDHPGFEIEAGAVTLHEIQERAASFDPVTLRTDAEVRAISDNAWFSLGRLGLGLHLERRPGRVVEALVLLRGGRGKRWEVSLDGKERARFSTIEEAVQAVDFEVTRFGRGAAASARPDASWRLDSRGEALRLATWNRLVGPKR
jgi:hypothetical protein